MKKIRKIKKGSINLKLCLKEFRDDSKRDPYHRYGSFHICNNYFKNYRGRQLKGSNLERSCVYLAAYLASWGMYRGSTKLLQKNAMCLKHVIFYIAQPKNDDFFRGLDLDQYNNKGVKEKILKGFEDIKKNLEKGTVIDPTPTLITKIMLGVWACVPAFDRYFNQGMKKYWGKGYTNPKKKLEAIAEFCNDETDKGENNLRNLRKLAKKPKLKMAKVLDMCFFKAGT